MTSDPVIDRTVGGVRVVGVSVAGIETCLAIPSYQLCFDIGRCHTGAARCRDVLISHGHVDHLGGLANHVAVRAMHRLAPSRLYGDPSLEEEVADLLRGWERRSRTPMPYAWTSVAPGEAIDLGRGLVARGLRASHRVPTLAWVVQRRETRLRPDLVGATGPEIAARVAAGEDVRVPYERIELGFSGDTRAALFDREPSLCAARVLLAECTFLDDAAAERADRTGHMSALDWAARADVLVNEHIVWTHLSTRYGREHVEGAIRRLPIGLQSRVTPWLPEVSPS